MLKWENENNILLHTVGSVCSANCRFTWKCKTDTVLKDTVTQCEPGSMCRECVFCISEIHICSYQLINTILIFIHKNAMLLGLGVGMMRFKIGLYALSGL